MLPIESTISENEARQAGYDNTRDLGWLNALRRNPYRYGSPEYRQYQIGVNNCIQEERNDGWPVNS